MMVVIGAAAVILVPIVERKSATLFIFVTCPCSGGTMTCKRKRNTLMLSWPEIHHSSVSSYGIKSNSKSYLITGKPKKVEFFPFFVRHEV